MPFLPVLLLAVLVATHFNRWATQAGVLSYFLKQPFDYQGPPSLHIPWFEPVFQVSAMAILFGLLIAQSRFRQIKVFASYRIGLLGLAAVLSGFLTVLIPYSVSKQWLSFDSTASRLLFVAALAFKLLAVICIWKATKHVGFLPNATPAEGSPGRVGIWPKARALIVLGAAIHLLFPVRWTLSLTMSLAGIGWPTWIDPIAQTPAGLAVDSVVAVGLAWLLMQQGQAGRVFDVPVTHVAFRVGFWAAALYVVLGASTSLLSAIPYGGGHVPYQVKTLFAVTQLIGLISIYAGLALWSTSSDLTTTDHRGFQRE